MTIKVPEAPTASPATNEQSISSFLHAEVMSDLDDGRPTLVAAAEANLGDLRETSPAQLRAMVTEARAELDRMERLANEYEARDTLAAIVAEHGLEVEEWDSSTLPPYLQGTFEAFNCVLKDGSHIVIVPKGQDPIKRVRVVADLINDLRRQA